MTTTQPQITATTHSLPFHQLSPRDFERLCLWLVEREGYERADRPFTLNTCYPVRAMI
jgi:hypothetical protein